MKRKFNLLLLLTVMFAFLLVGCDKGNEELSYVTIETNPSVELVVNGKGVVVAVNGLNEDGKLLINGEKIEGQKVEAAVTTVVSLGEELGFIFKGNATASSQAITISVTSNLPEVAEKVQNQVQTKVNELIESLDLDAKVEVAKAKSKEYFEKIAMAYDPTLTAEEAKAMTMKELLDVCKLATLEKAEFATVKLEQYYNDLKEYEFKLKYKEEISDALEGVNDALANQYKQLLTKVSETINGLKQTEVAIFSDPDSSYVKALNEFYTKKQELMEKKVELSVKLQAGESTTQLELTIKGLETALNIAEGLVKAADETFQASFSQMIKSLETVYDQLEALEEQFPTDLNIADKLTEAENYINNNKTELFNKFEQSISKEKLDQIEKDLADRKAALKAAVEAAKAK